jgi:hypothetical protein
MTDLEPVKRLLDEGRPALAGRCRQSASVAIAAGPDEGVGIPAFGRDQRREDRRIVCGADADRQSVTDGIVWSPLSCRDGLTATPQKNADVQMRRNAASQGITCCPVVFTPSRIFARCRPAAENAAEAFRYLKWLSRYSGRSASRC